MYVHWREREHEDISALVGEDPNVVAALMQCGLLKLFLCPFMRAQPRLLNALVDYWHPDAEAFMMEGKSLVPMTEDIYFLTGLSRRGEPVNFHTFPSGPHNILELIGLYCEAGTDRTSSQVSISKISDLALQAIVFLIGWITGSVCFASGFPCTDELCSSVLKCIDFLLEHHIIGLYEETTDRLSVMDSEELWVWNHSLLFLF
jgi:hypothetical protein